MQLPHESQSGGYELSVDRRRYQLTRQNIARTCSGLAMTVAGIIGLIAGGLFMVFGAISAKWSAVVVGVVFFGLSLCTVARTIAASERWTLDADSRRLEHVVELLGRVTSERSWAVPADARVWVRGGYKGVFALNLEWDEQDVQVLTTNDHEFVRENLRVLSTYLGIPAEVGENVPNRHGTFDI
jgi:hypothetical protein